MIIANLGANVTLPCELQSKDTMFFGSIRAKWSKLADDEPLYEDVLLSMGMHTKTFGNYEDRAFIEESEDEDFSLMLIDVSMEDMGKYRCEINNGMEDTIQDIILEVKGGVIDGKSYFLYLFRNLT